MHGSACRVAMGRIPVDDTMGNIFIKQSKMRLSAGCIVRVARRPSLSAIRKLLLAHLTALEQLRQPLPILRAGLSQHW